MEVRLGNAASDESERHRGAAQGERFRAWQTSLQGGQSTHNFHFAGWRSTSDTASLAVRGVNICKIARRAPRCDGNARVRLGAATKRRVAQRDMFDSPSILEYS